MARMDEASWMLMGYSTNGLDMATREDVIDGIGAGTGSFARPNEEATLSLLVHGIEAVERIDPSSHDPIVLHGNNGEVANGLLLLLLEPFLRLWHYLHFPTAVFEL